VSREIKTKGDVDCIFGKKSRGKVVVKGERTKLGGGAAACGPGEERYSLQDTSTRGGAMIQTC